MSATPHPRLTDMRVKASRCEGSFARQTNFADGQRSFICPACIFEPYAKYNITAVDLNAAPEAGRALMFLVSEKAAATDDVRNLWRHHLVPAFVAISDAFENVS